MDSPSETEFERLRGELAVARAEAEERVQQHTREWTAVFEISQAIVSQRELDGILQSVTDRARALLQADRAALCLLRPDGTSLQLAAVSGMGTALEGTQQLLDMPIPSRVVLQGEAVVAEAACAFCRFLPDRAGECAAAPLTVGTRPLGALCVVRDGPVPLTSEEIRAVTLLANSAAIAIANARLAESGRRQAGEAAALAERERLAADLHDHLAQTLGFLNLKVDAIEGRLARRNEPEIRTELSRIRAALDLASAQVRAVLLGLREAYGPQPVVEESLRICVEEMADGSAMQIDLRIEDRSALRIDPLAQSQGLQIVRGALTNVVRHARAQRATVRVGRQGRQAVWSVDDDGIGFEVEQPAGREHIGLEIMRIRAEKSGGRLTVESASGAGTRVTVRYPLAGAGASVTDAVEEAA